MGPKNITITWTTCLLSLAINLLLFQLQNNHTHTSISKFDKPPFSLNKSLFIHTTWVLVHTWVQLHHHHLFPCTRLSFSAALACFSPLWLARVVRLTGWHCSTSKARLVKILSGSWALGMIASTFANGKVFPVVADIKGSLCWTCNLRNW